MRDHDPTQPASPAPRKLRDVRTLPFPTEGREHPWAVFFDPLRQTRSERRLPQGSDPRCALLTIAQNEAVFLPIWLRYYSRFFSPEDIYVLDHQSSDGSTEGPGFVRVPVEHQTFDNLWIVSTMETHQHELLQRYDAVLTVDIDEIVAPRPEWGTLGDYLDRFNEDFVNCIGYEILHMKDIEAPFRPDEPVLAQRRYWFANPAYDKPALATTPTRWKPGFHQREDDELALDPDLFMIHLHRVDYDFCLARHRRWRSRTWNERDLSAGWGTHNRITDEERFARWFYSDCGFARETQIVVEPIPAAWNGLF